MIKQAKKFAVQAHRDVNQTYGNDLPYEFHLGMVVSFAKGFIHLIDDPEIVIAGIWCHDVIEDTGKSYNDVVEATCKEVAEIAFALTNEKGRTRAERANDKYYQGIREHKNFVFAKLCDRLANVSYSKETGNSMFKKYQKEHAHFVEQLYREDLKEMFDYLEEIIRGE